MSRAMHICMNVRSILSWPDDVIEERVGGLKKDGVEYRKAGEIRQTLEEALNAGWEWLPVGNCDNFDPKTGCKGHALPEDT